MEEKGKNRRGRGFAIGFALGIPLGMPIGIALDNLAIGPAIGIAIGAGLGAAMESAYRKSEEMETPDSSRQRKFRRGILIGLLALSALALLLVYLLAKTRY
jgi:hypothetical protein